MARILIFFILLSSLWSPFSATSVIGVSPNRLPLYDPSKDFTCLDGSKIVSFLSVNDDYCDCLDGSDEPGTSACPNGRFFCKNNGYLPELVPSSRVNDGICDCCDGSDEYGNEGLCQDNCVELGKEYREQKKKEKEIFDQGVALREELSQEGKKKKEERLSEIAELQKQADEKKTRAEELKAIKESVEVLESEAKDKHDKEWEEKINKLRAERETERATAAFTALDSDESGSITVQELTAATNLDKPYTEEEAKELIGGQDSVDKDLFVSQLWNSTFKDKFNKAKPVEEPKVAEEKSEQERPTEASPPSENIEPPTVDGGSEGESAVEDEKDLDSVTKLDEHEVDDDNDDEDEDDEDDEGDDVAPPAESTKSEDDEGLPTKPDYDEDTKKLIEDADKARKDFDDASREKDDLLKRLADIDRLTKTDMGEHEEFSPLQGQCFEFSDREYTYKLCPFEKASQSSKSGGSEVSLGTWGEWSGNPNKYTEMKFTNGLGCWNGPNRSVTVKLQCGVNNELVSVTEPNKCEYEFIFKTPSSCHPDSHKHDEF